MVTLGNLAGNALKKTGKSVKRVGKDLQPYVPPPVNQSPPEFTPTDGTDPNFSLDGQYAGGSGGSGGSGGGGGGSGSNLGNLALFQNQDYFNAQNQYNTSLGKLEMEQGQNRLNYINNNYNNQLSQLKEQYATSLGQFNQGAAASGAYTATGNNQQRYHMAFNEALGQNMLTQSRDYQTQQVNDALKKQYAAMLLASLQNSQNLQYNRAAMNESGINDYYNALHPGNL